MRPPLTREQRRQSLSGGVRHLDQSDRGRCPGVVHARRQPPVPGPGTLDVERERRRQGQACAERPRSRRTDNHVVPPAGLRQVGHRAKSEELLEPGHCREFLRRKGVQIGFRETRGQHRAGRAPGRLQQGQVSSAIASRCPPPVSGPRSSVRMRTGSPAALGSTGTPRTSPSEWAWSVEITSTRLAVHRGPHRGRCGQRRLADSALCRRRSRAAPPRLGCHRPSAPPSTRL